MDERLDQLINLDVNERGIGPLYRAARAHAGAPLVRAAAELLAAAPRGSRVVVTTGMATRPWVSTALIENDGPAGTAVLARALAVGLGLLPVMVAEEEVLDPLRAMLRAVGLTVVDGSPPELSDLAVAELRSFPQEDEAARLAAGPTLDALQPAALVTVERAGRNDRGVYHNMRGQDIGLGKARLDFLFQEAARRGLPTIGIGDGGNEIGMGLVADAVREEVPHSDVCRCGCGGGVVAVVATDVLVTAGVSNWACYAITASLAARLGRESLFHTAADEERLLRYGVELGLLDSPRGIIDADVDAWPLRAHMAVVELIAEIGRRSMVR
jgi:hypothetical protein